MRIRGTSLILAVMIVALAMAGAIWLQDYRQFPWIVFIALVFPAHLIVLIAAGGPHEANGEPYLGVAIFIIATMMWYGLFEGARRLLPGRRKSDHCSNA